MIVHRRVSVIHSSPTRPVMRAASAKANGTAKPVNPRYRATGWVIMPVSSRSGFSPRPSGGIGESRSKGGAGSAITRRKKAAMASITDSTHGNSSGWRRR